MLRWTAHGKVIQIDDLEGYTGYAHINPGGDWDRGIPHTEDREHAERIVNCLNALEGVKDPAAAVKAARDALGYLLSAVEWDDVQEAGGEPLREAIEAGIVALNQLQGQA